MADSAALSGAARRKWFVRRTPAAAEAGILCSSFVTTACAPQKRPGGARHATGRRGHFRIGHEREQSGNVDGAGDPDPEPTARNALGSEPEGRPARYFPSVAAHPCWRLRARGSVVRRRFSGIGGVRRDPCRPIAHGEAAVSLRSSAEEPRSSGCQPVPFTRAPNMEEQKRHNRRC